VKVILDSNVLMAAFGSRGLCEAILEVCLSDHELYISEAILNKVRSHLSDKFKLSSQQIDENLGMLRDECTWVYPATIPKNACRDPDDLLILGTALAAGADCLVTGGRDLLVLTTFQGIPILSPRSFYEQLTK